MSADDIGGLALADIFFVGSCVDTALMRCGSLVGTRRRSTRKWGCFANGELMSFFWERRAFVSLHGVGIEPLESHALLL